MRFIIVCKKVGDSETWEEDYDCDEKNVHSDKDAMEWGREIVEWFNSTITSPYESPREFVSARIIAGIVR